MYLYSESRVATAEKVSNSFHIFIPAPLLGLSSGGSSRGLWWVSRREGRFDPGCAAAAPSSVSAVLVSLLSPRA